MSLFSCQTYKLYFVAFLYFYTLFFTFYHVLGMELFKVITDISAVFTIIYTFFVIVSLAIKFGIYRRYFIVLNSIFFVLIFHIAFNFGKTDLVDVLKFFSLFLFSFLGLGFGRYRFLLSKKLLFFLYVMPLVVELLGGSKINVNGSEFASFPNNNTAVMYYIILTGVVLEQFNKSSKYAILFFIITLFFQKIGAMLSVMTSFVVVYKIKFDKYLPFILISIVLLFSVVFSLNLLDRIIDVMSGLYNLIVNYSIAEISSMEYVRLLSETNSTDLSAVFRIRHWSEMFAYYTSQGIDTTLFGYGAKYTMIVTTENLMPHSDMMRVLCEFGLLSFILFISLYYLLFVNIISKHLKLSLLLVVFYYFSENLIDNFISMYLLHVIVGSKDCVIKKST